MFSSLSLACKLTPPPHSNIHKFVANPKSTTTTAPAPATTTTTTTLPFRFKSRSQKPPNTSFVPYAVSPSKNGSITFPEKEQAHLLSKKQPPNGERDTFLEHIEALELKIQELERQNSVQPAASASEAGANMAKPLIGILQDIQTLTYKIHELEPQNSIQTPSVIEAVTNITKQLQVLKEQVVDGPTDDGVLEVTPKPNKGQASIMLDLMFEMVTHLYHKHPLDNPVLDGNFAPIRVETPPTPIEDSKVSNPLPVSLNGMMIRNGPDPPFDPIANYMWLDGDSMLHGILFKDGQASYVSRYVKTSRFMQEKFFGKAQFFKYGDLTGLFGLFAAFVQLLKTKLDVLDMTYGWGNGDTSLIYHGGRLMALEDFDKPYIVNIREDGDLETLGINNYGKKLTHNFTPHPKIDPITGELFTFGASYTPPYAIYNVVSKNGDMSDPVPITISRPSYMHDFGITENYAIFMDLPYYFDPVSMVKYDEWIYSFDGNAKSRFGILPRYAKNETEIKWFEFDNPFYIFHNANSWEEGDEIVLVSCRMVATEPTEDNPRHCLTHLNMRRADTSHKLELNLPQLYEFKFNMSTGQATQKLLSATYIDYPKVNDNYIGRKAQYVYTSEVDASGKIPALVKFDMQAGDETKLVFGDNIYGSEVVFAPRPDMTSEDDAYLITFVHDENEEVSKSFVYVIDAKNMTTVSVVELPKRVPYGFHALFLTKEQIQEQMKILT